MTAGLASCALLTILGIKVDRSSTDCQLFSSSAAHCLWLILYLGCGLPHLRIRSFDCSHALFLTTLPPVGSVLLGSVEYLLVP